MTQQEKIMEDKELEKILNHLRSGSNPGTDYVSKAKAQLVYLIQQKCNKARIEELISVRYTADEGSRTEKYIDKRIKELFAQDGGRTNG